MELTLKYKLVVTLPDPSGYLYDMKAVLSEHDFNGRNRF